MEIPLCLTLNELAHRTSFRRSALEIFRILNLSRPADWTVLVSFSATGPRVLFSLDAEIDPTVIVCSTPIGLFDYRTITLSRDGRAYTADWREQLETDPYGNRLRFHEVDASNYPPCFLEVAQSEASPVPAEFGEFDELEEFLLSHTWLGSKGLAHQRFRFRITAMGHSWELANAWQHRDKLLAEKAKSIPVLEIEHSLGSPVLGTLYFTCSWNHSDHSFRWTESGCVSESELKALGWELATSSLSPGEVEIRFPARELGPDGTYAKHSTLAKVLKEAAAKCTAIHTDTRYRGFVKQCRLFTRRESASRIDERKERLSTTEFVYWNQRLVYKLPTNENELVSLHQKLEGMGGVPFAEFSSLEYTPRLGIDAIANFKIRLTEPLKQLATVEFEYRLESFFRHDHPLEQTDLIVCWDGAEEVPAGTIHRDPTRSWLWFLHSGNRVVPIARVKDYPQIETHVRKKE